MIITQIYGGLGNQLFQFAAGFSLARMKNTSLKIDNQFFEKQYSHSFNLEIYKLQFEKATEKDLNFIKKRQWPRILQSLYYRVQKILPYYKRNLYNEQNNIFDKHFKNSSSNCILNGYWQDCRYFIEFDTEIRKLFKIKEELLSENYFELLEKVTSTNSVSLHFRRGDYVTLGIKAPSLLYYYSAINFLQNQFSDLDLIFFVFSDDIKWCKDNINLPELNIIFIETGFGLSGPEEMQLMSNCKHNIIANSTFSWWGAFLNDNKDKVVIYPAIYKEMLNPDLMLKQWIQLN
jgi:hypothetical protein